MQKKKQKKNRGVCVQGLDRQSSFRNDADTEIGRPKHTCTDYKEK